MSSEIDREGPVPIYRQVAAVLLARIESGEYPVNRALPSEPDLSVEFGVTRNTVRAAIRVLAEQGRVQTVAGRGTFVTPSAE